METQDTSRVARRWLVPGVVLVSVYYAWLVQRHAAMPDGSGGIYGMDYRDTVWLPLRDIFAGHNPWDWPSYSERYPFAQNFPIYTPSYWLPSLPLVVLPYRWGLLVWTLASTCLLGWTVWACMVRFARPLLARWPQAALAVFLLVAIARPGRGGLTSANWATPSACGAALLLMNTRSLPTLGLMAALVKPQTGLAALWTAALMRRWRHALAAIVYSMALAVPPMAFMAYRTGLPALTHSLLHETLPLGDGPGGGPSSPFSTRVDTLGAWGHLWALPGAVVSAVVVASVGLALSVLTLAALRHGGLKDPAFLVGAGLLVCVVIPNQVYAVPVLLPAIAALLGRVFVGSPHARRLDVVTLLFLLVPYGLTNPVPVLLGLSPQMAAFLAGAALHLAGAVAAIALWLGRSAEDQRFRGADLGRSGA